MSKQPGACKEAIKDKKQFPDVKSFYGGRLRRKGRNGMEKKPLISHPKTSSWMLPKHRETQGMTCALYDPWTKGLGEGEGGSGVAGGVLDRIRTSRTASFIPAKRRQGLSM